MRTAIAEEFAPFASQAREVWDAAARAHRGRFEVLRASLRRLEADDETTAPPPRTPPGS